MELIFFCRIAADLCLYFAYASFLLPYFTQARISFAPLFILSIAALAAFFLRKKRVLSLAVMAAALLLLIPFGWPVPFIVSLPPWIYVSYIIYRQYLGANYLQQRDSLKRSCYLFLGFIVLLALTANSGGFEAFSSRALPYLLFFMLCAVVQLRLLRPDDASLRSPKNQFMHAGLMAGITLLGYMLSRSGAYELIKRGIGFVYTKVIGPVFTLLVTIIATPFFYLLKWIFSLFNTEFEFETLEGMGKGDLDPREMAVETSKNAPEWIKWIFAALLAALVIWIIFRFFRMLLGQVRLREEKKGLSTERSAIASSDRPSILQRMQDMTSVRGRIRAQFRQLCAKLKKEGRLSPGDSSRSVIEKSMEALAPDAAPDKEAWYGFRDIYVRARYDEREEAVSAADVSKMKEYAKRL